jgi:Helix-turn-helix domain
MDIFARLDSKAIKDGLITKVGGVKHFAILATIAAYSDANGESYPSQDTIAELVGYSRKTVNETIRQLRKTTIDGEPILTVQQVKTSSGIRNVYKLSPKSGFSFGRVTKGDNVVTPKGKHNVTPTLQEEYPVSKNNQYKKNNHNNNLFNNSKEVLQYFRDKYFKKYNVVYQANWARDCSMIKNKLMANFTDYEIKSIIDIVFEEYDNRWANARFPRPSIGQLCSWLPNEALAIIKKRQEEAEAIEAASERYEMNDDQFERLLNEI